MVFFLFGEGGGRLDCFEKKKFNIEVIILYRGIHGASIEMYKMFRGGNEITRDRTASWKQILNHDDCLR